MSGSTRRQWNRSSFNSQRRGPRQRIGSQQGKWLLAASGPPRPFDWTKDQFKAIRRRAIIGARAQRRLPQNNASRREPSHMGSRKRYDGQANGQATSTERQARRVAIELTLAIFLAVAFTVLRQLPCYAQDRTQLPIPDTQYKYPGKVPLDARDAKFPPLRELRPPKGAPNVVVILIDDMGFGIPSTFGGGVNMPALDSLAREGLRYTQFHTAALCSPTRQALLTGRNHHSVGMGAVADIATAAPGYNSIRPNEAATIAQIMRMNGYNTAAFGKWHQTPVWQVSVSGPFTHWPTGEGFEKFYGFIGGETNQWSPLIYDGVAHVEPPRRPGYNFMTDMTDQAIAWMRFQHTMTPDKPFFLYFAPGAVHAPHHTPKEWRDKYAGKFGEGWDKYREETLARQKRLGVVPQTTKLAPWAPGVKHWDELSPDQKKAAELLMENFAGFSEYTDHEIGRLIDALKHLGIFDNTLIFYIAGDNGMSAEGGLAGTINEMASFNGVPDTAENILKHAAEIGGPMTFPHIPVGWALAGDTPFQWTKQVASHYGGTRNGMVISWPARIKDAGGIRTQWHHVIDITPTILEAAKLPQPKTVDGVKQKPIEGVSMVYTFDNPNAPTRHRTQYFEIFGNRGIYHDGWTAVTKHRTPWLAIEKPPKFTEDKWELYNTNDDFSQSRDLAAKYPDKLKELQQLFLAEAEKYNVLPLDDRTAERFVPALAGRPSLMGPRTSITLYPGMTAMAENATLDIKNRSHSVTAIVQIPNKGAEGVIIAQGGRFGGWSLYMKGGKLKYCYNWLGRTRYTLESKDIIPAGKATLKFEFAYDGGGLGKGGTGRLYVNDQKAAEGRIDRTVPFIFSADETEDVGEDLGTPVTEDYKEGENQFTGIIEKVTIATTPPGPKVERNESAGEAAVAEGEN
jgi:arylsulfatase A-like enzyme